MTDRPCDTEAPERVGDERYAGAEHQGKWAQTFRGVRFTSLAPRVRDIDIRDIAHHLSMLRRYGGATDRFYSVAEHSVHIARRTTPVNRLAALVHDSPEAYSPFGDVPRLFKAEFPCVGEVEHVLAAAIAQKFGISHQYPWPDEVKELDRRICADETAALLGPLQPDFYGPGVPVPEPLGVKIECWGPFEAECKFLHMFDRCVGS